MSLVLVVEDDASIRDVLLMILESEGYRIAQAADGQQALEWLATGGEPDLILLDLMMPRLDGCQFLACRAALPNPPSAPVVVLSGGDVESTPDGAQALLKKPVSVEDLLAAIEQQLGRPNR
jgi:CheY-like chemotaxis protein